MAQITLQQLRAERLAAREAKLKEESMAQLVTPSMIMAQRIAARKAKLERDEQARQAGKDPDAKLCCKSCGHCEKTNKEFWIKLVGASMPAGGFWAWTTYFFAGTGMAFGLCAAMVAGGVGILVYKDEVVKWLADNGHVCPKCGKQGWELLKGD